MGWARAFALSLLVAGCATSQPPADAGMDPDLSIGHCDPQQLFATCSDQCHMKVCIVAAASCEGTQWICDCAKTGPCLMHD
jgi:hypothetical protein